MKVLRLENDGDFIWQGSAAIATLLFLHSLWVGGLTWDVELHFKGTEQQLELARNVLLGTGDVTARSFRSISSDLAFYGIGTLLPAYALSYVVDHAVGSQHTYYNSYAVISNLIAFGSGLLAAWFAGRLVYLSSRDNEIGAWAAASLVLLPPWLGYTFFNYKDVPIATGVVASVYFAVLYGQRADWRSLAGFFAALWWLGSHKLAAVPLGLPAAAYVLISLVHSDALDRQRVFVFAAQAVLFVLLLYVATPPAWTAPIEFARTNVAYMAEHGWYGCTLTAGECIGRGSAEKPRLYSPLRYIGLWYGVQMPLLYMLSAAIALGCYLHRRADALRNLLFAAICWPLLVIIWKQSTLYDGIRHTLFLLPLVIAFIFVNVPAVDRRRFRIGLAGYLFFLLVDGLALRPYAYVWVNEVARRFVNQENYETDYWGFSLKEATRIAQPLIAETDYVVGKPPHLVSPFNHRGKMVITVDDVPSGADYILIAVTRSNSKPTANCVRLKSVERTEPLGLRLELAFIARCVKR